MIGNKHSVVQVQMAFQEEWPVWATTYTIAQMLFFKTTKKFRRTSIQSHKILKRP